MMEISTDMLQKLASRTVRPGEVYRMELTPNEGVIPKNDGDTSRNKYFVVMGVTEDGDLIGLVLINTEINPHVSQRLRDSHLPTGEGPSCQICTLILPNLHVKLAK